MTGGVSTLTKKRHLVLLIIYFLISAVLLGRVAYWQFIEGDRLRKEAFNQQNRGRIISPKRGTIYDRNGKELAVSASVDTVWVNPIDIASSEVSMEKVAKDLSSMLDMDEAEVYSIITKKTTFNYLKRKIDREVGDQIRKWIADNKIKGVYVDEDTKRYYPKRNLASHILGYTGSDNQGLAGIEAAMEKYLKGVPGKILSELDADGREIPFTEEKRIEAQDGLNVVLTIDETIQYFTEKALEKAIFENKIANGASAIVMDPRNGEILALSSKPDFDPNNPRLPPPGYESENWTGYTKEEVDILWSTVWRNKALVDTYEPGSTFKAITTAMGLEEGLVTPDTPVNDYPVEIGGWDISCWRDWPHGEETFREGVYNSCNPVFVRLAQKIGISKFYEYMRAFGFFDKTGIELPEGSSVIHENPAEIDMAVASFGQRFQITPIQLITAYSAIANGGTLIKPRIVKELTDNEGNIVKKFEPETVRTVVSKETTRTLLDILEGVVTDGTGRNAYVSGYKVAGKTGTSQTTEAGRYIASFAAIAPADNPIITVLVILDNPKGFSYMGGAVAAPVAGGLVEDILDYLGVERRYTEKDKERMKTEVYVPDVRDKKLSEAINVLKQYGLEHKVERNASGGNADEIVVEQTPKPGVSVPDNSVVILYTYKPEEEVMATVPDVLNMTIAEATKTLNDAGLNIKIEGMGTSVSQSVEPGTKIAKGSVVKVQFVYLDNIE